MIDRKAEFEKLFGAWLDGKLTGKQVEDLRILMEENAEFGDEFETFPVVNPECDLKFSRKDKVKKTTADYLDSQFGHMCIARLENDLSGDEIREFDEMLGHDQRRRDAFAFILKLKLKPPEYVFEGKGGLKKTTPGRKVLRFTSWSLGAAATIALLIVAYLSSPSEKTAAKFNTSGPVITDTLLIERPVLISPAVKRTFFKKVAALPKAVNLNSVTDFRIEGHLSVNATRTADSGSARTDPGIRESALAPHDALPVPAVIPLKTSEIVLRPFRPAFVPSEYEEERSNVDRFFAGIFHRVIMKETIATDRKVEKYEIAEAGITGINKLFGWQMALEKNANENGETRSYFSSRLFKFNAPVKKTNSAM
ncbi:MAG: hypothetical protein WCE64_03725 [Bacteroidales bacterium]